MSASALVTFLRSGASAARCSAASRRASCAVCFAAPFAFALARGASGSAPRSARHSVAVLVHVAVVGAHGAAAHDPQAVGAGVHQVAVVADQDHRALVVVERAHQRFACVDIEMVGGLVEDQQVRPVEGGEREQQPRLLAAGEVLRLGVGLADAEARACRAWCAAAPRWRRASGRACAGRASCRRAGRPSGAGRSSRPRSCRRRSGARPWAPCARRSAWRRCSCRCRWRRAGRRGRRRRAADPGPAAPGSPGT